MARRQTAVAEEDTPRTTFDDCKTKIFREVGEGSYEMQVLPAGIKFAVERLRRERHDLTGEIAVSIDPRHFTTARHYNGMIAIGDLNFSSVQARSSRGKLLEERSGRAFDWYGLLEEFVIQVQTAERMGKPGIVLADIEEPPVEDTAKWTIEGFPLLQTLPMAIYGDGASGKSLFALWLAGKLAERLRDSNQSILYLDWEFDGVEHKKRLRKLFKPEPRNIIYLRCDSSLYSQVDRIKRMIKLYNAIYVVCDSIGFAIDGPAQDQESARHYFKGLRQLGVGSLNVGHIPKGSNDGGTGKEVSLFGSIFFRNGVRSGWYVEAAATNPSGELRFGVHHKKTNVGQYLPSLGYKALFVGDHTITIEPVDPKQVDELTAQLPLLERVKQELSRTKLSQKALAETLNVPIGSIKSILSRHKSQFIKMGNVYGVLAAGDDF